MKNLVLALSALLLPMTAQAQRVDVYAVRAAQNLVADLDNLHFEAQNTVRLANAPIVRQRAQQIARDSRVLSRQIQQEVVRELQRGTRTVIVARNFERISFSIEDTVRDALAMNAPAARNLSFAASRVEDSLRKVSYALHTTGPGPGPGPGRQGFEATCRVVLETIWGQDIQDFYGYATATSEAVATNLARQDGQRQCQYSLSGFNRCTVASCDANRIRL